MASLPLLVKTHPTIAKKSDVYILQALMDFMILLAVSYDTLRHSRWYLSIIFENLRHILR